MVIEISYIDLIFLGLLIFITGVTSGIFMTYYFRSKGWVEAEHIQKIFAYFFAIVYVLLQVYIVLTQGKALDWFFSAAGFAVIGHVLGIRLAKYLSLKR